MFCSIRTGVFRGINALYRQQQQRGKKSLKGRGKQKKQGKPKIAKQTIEAKSTDEPKENTGKPLIGQAYHDGSNWYLPAGTLVKHGTTTNNIRQILKYGLLPGNIEGRSEDRKLAEPLPITNNGVYVGSCYVAYHSSMYNFAANIKALVKSKNITSCRFDQIKRKMMDVMLSVGVKENVLRKLSDLLMHKYVNKDRKDIEACGLPIVLNIKLKENVRIHADEDFVPVRSECNSDNIALMSLCAGQSWNEYGSTVLLQSIPPDWIQTFEYFEHNFQYEFFALEKYVVTNSLKDESEWNDSDKSNEFAQFMTKEKKKRSLARQNFEFDFFHVCMAAKICKNKPTDARQQWKNIVKRSNAFSKFRNKIDIESYLDELEGNNYLDMLGAAYNLNERLVEKAEELGLDVISEKSLSNVL